MTETAADHALIIKGVDLRCGVETTVAQARSTAGATSPWAWYATDTTQEDPFFGVPSPRFTSAMAVLLSET